MKKVVAALPKPLRRPIFSPHIPGAMENTQQHAVSSVCRGLLPDYSVFREIVVLIWYDK